MIKFEHTEVMGFEYAIRGMRNPMNSWDKSDSYYTNCALDPYFYFCENCPRLQECDGVTDEFIIGPNDLNLMKRLRNSGTDHRKFMRMIVVYVDITAPLYWWKEFDTYRTGVTPNPMDIEMNSCSTMHKITEKEFTLDDFSCEHLFNKYGDPSMNLNYSGKHPVGVMKDLIQVLNHFRKWFLETKDKNYWWQIIQLLPSSYNQKRTVMMNYEVLANIYHSRKNHKLDEWREGFMSWIDTLPYCELIKGENLKGE